MWRALKRHWHELRSSRPGHRFQEQYERHQRARHQHSLIRKFAQPAAGFVILAAGIFFCVFPGPGLPLVVIGAALLAGESLLVARPMDWLELRIRKMLSWLWRTWSHTTLTGKCAAVVLVMAAASGVCYGGYQFFVH